MATNPDNAVGTNAAYGGRTSVNAFNDVLAAYTRGIMTGWECQPSSGLTVALGGRGNVRDVAVAEDNSGNKTSINNISGAPVDVTMSAAPGTNSRIDAIVAYVDNPPQGSSTIADNYEACGLIAVDGVAAADPVAPNDSAIRSAITADGASGTTAYYVVLATVTIASGTTDITSDMIEEGAGAVPTANGRWVPDYANRGSTSILAGSNTAFTAPGDGWIDFQEIYKYTGGGGSNTYLVVTINDVQVVRYVVSSGSNFQYSGILPVANGDQIKVTYNADSGSPKAYFIPGRWV